MNRKNTRQLGLIPGYTCYIDNQLNHEVRTTMPTDPDHYKTKYKVRSVLVGHYSTVAGALRAAKIHQRQATGGTLPEWMKDEKSR